MTRWKALDAPAGAQVQETFSAGAALGAITDALLTKLRTGLLPKLKMGLVEGMDGPNSITCCSAFRTGTPGPDGQPISVDAYVRVEADRGGNRFRVTVRSKNQKIASGILQVLKGQLA